MDANAQDFPRTVRQAVIVFEREKQADAAADKLWKLKSFTGETYVGPLGGRYVLKIFAEHPVRLSALKSLGGELTVLDGTDGDDARPPADGKRGRAT